MDNVLSWRLYNDFIIIYNFHNIIVYLHDICVFVDER